MLRQRIMSKVELCQRATIRAHPPTFLCPETARFLLSSSALARSFIFSSFFLLQLASHADLTCISSVHYSHSVKREGEREVDLFIKDQTVTAHSSDWHSSHQTLPCGQPQELGLFISHYEFPYSLLPGIKFLTAIGKLPSRTVCSIRASI